MMLRSIEFGIIVTLAHSPSLGPRQRRVVHPATDGRDRGSLPRRHPTCWIRAQIRTHCTPQRFELTERCGYSITAAEVVLVEGNQLRLSSFHHIVGSKPGSYRITQSDGSGSAKTTGRPTSDRQRIARSTDSRP